MKEVKEGLEVRKGVDSIIIYSKNLFLNSIKIKIKLNGLFSLFFNRYYRINKV